jgi:hypothetical protein
MARHLSPAGTTSHECRRHITHTLLFCPLLLQVPGTLQTLSEIMNAHESALQAPSSSDAASPSQNDAAAAAFTPVLEALLGPLLEVCRRSAAVLAVGSSDRLDEGAKLDPSAHPIYLINCLAACQVPLVFNGRGLRGSPCTCHLVGHGHCLHVLLPSSPLVFGMCMADIDWQVFSTNGCRCLSAGAMQVPGGFVLKYPSQARARV